MAKVHPSLVSIPNNYCKIHNYILSAPNGVAQRELLRTALKKAKTNPDEISYIETHGTGTALGDPIEWGAIREVFLEKGSSEDLLVIGAVKSNIGHLEGASGMAGLIKAIMSIRNGSVPGNLNLETLNPLMNLIGCNRKVVFPKENIILPSGRKSIKASVSSFGSGGTNANVIIEAYPHATLDSNFYSLIKQGDVDKSDKDIVFLFAGQGSNYKEMGKELFLRESTYREIVQNCSEELNELSNPTLLQFMYPEESKNEGSENDCRVEYNEYIYSQLALYTFEVGLAALWRSRGIYPSFVLGYSLGEYSAAAVLGIFSIKNGLNIVHQRAKCIVTLGNRGKMVALRMSYEETLSAIAEFKRKSDPVGVIDIASVMGPMSTVISGEDNVLAAFLIDIGRVSHKYLDLTFAYHSSLLKDIVEDFKSSTVSIFDNISQQNLKDRYEANGTSFVSCFTGKTIDPNTLLTVDYWISQMLGTVQFYGAVDMLLRQSNLNQYIFIEIGPKDTLTRLISSLQKTSQHINISTLKNDIDSLDSFNDSVDYVKKNSMFSKQKVYKPYYLPWRKNDSCYHEESRDKMRGRNDLSQNNRIELVNLLQQSISTVLNEPNHINILEDTSLLSLGVDSLAAITIRNAIVKYTGLQNLSNTFVLTLDTIGSIVQYILDNGTFHIPLPSSTNIPEDPNPFPTSRLQQAMIYFQLLDSSKHYFLETFTWKVKGLFDINRFYYSWIHTIKCHSSLRLFFDLLATPVAHQTIASIDHPVLNARMEQSKWFSVSQYTGDTNGLDGFINESIKSQRNFDFDITEPFLFSIKVIILPDAFVDKYMVIATFHHLIIDGYSVNILLKSLSSSYDKDSKKLESPELQIPKSTFKQFIDYEDNIVKVSFNRYHEYWSSVLSKALVPNSYRNIMLPTVNLSDDAVIRLSYSFAPDVVDSLSSLCKELKVTLASLLHCAFSLAYSQRVEQKILIYGNTSSGRTSDVSDIGSLVGPVINTFPIAIEVMENCFIIDFIKSIHTQLLGSLEYATFPLSEIQKNSKIKGTLFTAIFDYQSEIWETSDSTSSTLNLVNAQLIDRVACPISIRILQRKNILQVNLVSESDSFDENYLNSFNNHICDIINLFADMKDMDKIKKMTVRDILNSGEKAKISETYYSNYELPVVASPQDVIEVPFALTDSNINDIRRISIDLNVDPHLVVICGLLVVIGRWNYESSFKAFIHKVHDSKNESSVVKFDINSSMSFLHHLIAMVKINSLKVPIYTQAIIIDNSSNIRYEGVSYFCVQGSDITNPIKINLSIAPREVILELSNSCEWIFEYLFTASNEPIEKYLRVENKVMSTKDLTSTLKLHSILLHEPFFKNESALTESIISMDRSGDRLTLSYSNLNTIALMTSSKLLLHVHPVSTSEYNSVVAVIMEKGWEQIAAVLAILRIQCAYLPIDARLWSEHRIRSVLKLSDTICIITQSFLLESSSFAWLKSLDIPVVTVDSLEESIADSIIFDSEEANRLVESIPRCHPKSLAYLIYTSGSTGVPKGVCCHHVGAVNTINDLNNRFGVGKSDRVLALSSLSFDLSVYDIFGLLSAGGGVVIPACSSLSPPDPGHWYELLVAEKVTIWNSVPAFMELLVTYLEYMNLKLPPSLRLIYLSGDWIPLKLPSRIEEVSECKQLKIISMGGATEAAIWSNIYEIDPDKHVPDGWTSIPYGSPMCNQDMFILNDRMEHCELWVTGSIYIGGVGVALGYYKDVDRTSSQFVRSPFDGSTLFRTGDLGRVRPGGLIEILGRQDLQVKVNGFRIELGEIERVLTEDSRLLSATLAVHNNSLCAYLIPRPTDCTEEKVDSEVLVSELRERCREKLTEYMIPQHFGFIDEIPLSPNGKVLRSALPNIFSFSSADNSYFSESELAICDIWASVLNIPPSSISLDSNFFSLGGDSLKSLQVVAQAKSRGLIISVPQLFSNPTISSLAKVANLKAYIGPDILGTNSEKLSDAPIFTVDHNDTTYPPDEYPLIGINQAHFVGLYTSSYVKKGMTPQIYFEWLIGDVDHSSDEDGQLDVERFETALNSFIQRHPTFQCVVTNNGNMKIKTDLPKYRIDNVYQWQGSEELVMKNCEKYRIEMMENAIQVDTWPLFDVRVTHTSDRSSMIHISISLFLLDAMSDLIFRQELSQLYRAPVSLPLDDVLPSKSSIQFRDYCISLNSKLHLSEEFQRAKQFWEEKILRLSSGPDIPITPGGNEINISVGKFFNQHRWLTSQEWKRARSNCSVHSVTIPAVLLTAYSLALYKWGTASKFLINILQCLRHQVHKDVNKMVGNCSSTILCDIDLDSSLDDNNLSFVEAVKRVAKELAVNLEYSSMSGVDVMQEMNRTRGKTFNVVAPFIFTTPIGVEQGNKQVQSRNWMFKEVFFSERVPHTACVNAIKADPDGSACASLDIIEGIFPTEVSKGLFATYSSILDLMCSKDPRSWTESFFEVLQTPSRVRTIEIKSNWDLGVLMHESVQEKSLQLSETNAIVCIDSSGDRLALSYSNLNTIALMTSSKLLLHVHPVSTSEYNSVVAVIMEKGWEQIAAVLAILRIQCAYLPIDARLWSEHRIRSVLKLSDTICIITQSFLLESSSFAWLKSLDIPVVTVDSLEESIADSIIFDSEEANRLVESIPRCHPKSLAYLIYTSGSTGVPKGVCCHHVGAVNTINDLNNRFGVGKSDRVLALSSLSFDLSVYDIFGLLSAGGGVVIPACSSLSPPDPGHWYELLVAEKVTIWNSVPAFMELLVTYLEYMNLKLPPSLRLIYLSGDWIPLKLPSRIEEVSECKQLKIISMGGATEAAIWSNIYEIDPDKHVPDGWTSIPYGSPMCNQDMFILNDRMEHCELWVTGSIYIGGVGVALGYYKDVDRTSSQFVRSPFDGSTLFRTGDLGRVRPGGLIEILGRQDLQVKVNGFRIELGEIERVLTEDSRLLSATLAVHNNSLCAYLIPRPTDCTEEKVDSEVLVSELRERCREKLTEYMIPQHFGFIDEIPLSPNGKVLRSALPNPFDANITDDVFSSSATSVVMPRNKVEMDCRQLFADLLHLSINVICCQKSSFFQLGGNSLTAIQLILEIRKRLGLSLSIQQLFMDPTVNGICKTLSTSNGQDIKDSDSQLMTSGYQLMELQPGDGLQTPVLLFNPAGASGLW